MAVTARQATGSCRRRVQVDYISFRRVQARSLPLGTTVWWRYLEDNPVARAVVAREFDSVTTENDLKMEFVQPREGEFDFQAGDELVGFARRHGMEIRGHTLVWGQQLPRWLTEPRDPWSRDELISILTNHIRTVVGRYRGQIAEWDVVNEAIAEDGSYTRNFWLEGIGPEYIELAFRWAREADPTARLFYNDFGIEGANPRSDAVFDLAADLRRRGVPIDGVGSQRHSFLGDVTSEADVVASLRRFASLGLRVRITEMDVTIPPANVAPSSLRAQAKLYRETASACRRVRACTGFTVWGVSDPFSWRGAETTPLFLDASYLGKPAYYAVRETLPVQ